YPVHIEESAVRQVVEVLDHLIEHLDAALKVIKAERWQLFMVTQQQPAVACLEGKRQIEPVYFSCFLNDGPVERPVEFLAAVSQRSEVSCRGSTICDIGASFYQLGKVACEARRFFCGWRCGSSS